jgi:hypothetical protein
MAIAPILTYDTLVNLIYAYLERRDDDVTNFIPFAIMLCESKLSNRLKQLGQQAVTVARMTDATGIVQKPVRWRKTISMHWIGQTGSLESTRSEMFNRSYEYVRDYKESIVNTTAKPLYYADYNFDYWLVAPAPKLNDQLEILYYERLNPLSTENQTNWFTINAPEAMIYGTLLEMTPFIKNDPRIAVWQAALQASMSSLVEEDTARAADRSTIRQEQQG